MYPKIMATFAIGGGAGFIIGTLPVILTSNSPWGPGLFLGLVIMLCVAAATAVQFSLLGLSGAALAEYRDVSNRVCVYPEVSTAGTA
jgi:ABC-type amino acid transport system permease subunit